VEFAPSAQGPYDFYFFSSQGHQHGLQDQWNNERFKIYSYTGEGQVGDYENLLRELGLDGTD